MLHRTTHWYKKNFNPETNETSSVDFLPLAPIIAAALPAMPRRLIGRPLMLTKIRNLLGRQQEARPPMLTPGERIYAVGDIHGRRDLFDPILEAIKQDTPPLPAPPPTLNP